MKKKVFGKKLSRERATRSALFVSLIRALVEHGKIKTTKAKAKAIQSEIDKLINTAKKDGIEPKRKIIAKLKNERKTAEALWTQVAPSMKERAGGYTRITNLPPRRGDMAEIVYLEWTEKVESTAKEEPKKKPRKEVKTKKETKIPRKKTVKEEKETKSTKSKPKFK